MALAPAPLAVSIGDPAGIGPEIVAAAWAARVAENLPPFFAIGDRRAIEAVWGGPVQTLAAPGDAAVAFAHALPLVQVDDPGGITPGDSNLAGARCALDSLEIAVGLARNGFAGGVVTGPVSKVQLYNIGFNYPGQTEFVAERCGIAACNAVMMLAGPSLRTVPVTVHTAIADVPRQLNTELIIAKARIAVRALVRDFGIAHPRLVIAGLNPHAGESGTLGREEIDIRGPLAADTMFHVGARDLFDVALCMYHDQALIPLKTLHFDDGVNVTLGLPIVRTSPDHGTAFGIAGKGVASPRAMIEAIRMAGACAARRLLA